MGISCGPKLNYNVERWACNKNTTRLIMSFVCMYVVDYRHIQKNKYKRMCGHNHKSMYNVEYAAVAGCHELTSAFLCMLGRSRGAVAQSSALSMTA